MPDEASRRTILVATDFSDHAAVALETAARIAEQQGARLLLVHAVLAMVPTAPEFIPVPASLYEELRMQARTQLDEKVSSLRKSGHLVESLVVAEPAAAGVLAVAAERKADLIVAGTRGRTGWQKLLLGSTAARLIREAPCPVVTVPRTTPSQRVRTVLIATDFSDDAAVAAQAAVRLVDGTEPNGRIVLLHAYRYPSALSGLEGPQLVDAISATHESAEKRLAELARGLATPGIAVATCAEPGEPTESILAKAGEIGAALIAMGTHGRSGLKRLFLGSNTERVVSAAPCAVLTAHVSARD
jgi:nucleotide-binding universal stress UspA family protein